uniref:Uncharacterized protein n=1 Tax=Glossina brevipalpis TaxID=37001 RepID=A0A1A9WU24_9MUSC
MGTSVVEASKFGPSVTSSCALSAETPKIKFISIVSTTTRNSTIVKSDLFIMKILKCFNICNTLTLFNLSQIIKYLEILNMRISALVLIALVFSLNVNFSVGFVISEKVEATEVSSYEERVGKANESSEELLHALRSLLALTESNDNNLKTKNLNRFERQTTNSATPSLLPTGTLTFKQILENLEKLQVHPMHEEVVQLIESNSNRITKLYEKLKEEIEDDDCDNDVFECFWSLFD